MNEELKSYGQIACGHYYGAMNAGRPSMLSMEWAAKAVVSAFKERELHEGWRLLGKDEPQKPGDEVLMRNKSGWEQITENWTGITPDEAGSTIRRRCLFWSGGEEESPVQPCPVQGGELASMIQERNFFLDRAVKAEAEAALLQRWKEEQLEVERQWDIQEVGRELGVGLGQHIRSEILPRIRMLKAELEAASRNEIASLQKQIEEGRATSRLLTAINERLQSQPLKKSPWIVCSKKRPMESDATDHVVLWKINDGPFKVAFWYAGENCSHWMPIPPLPGPTMPEDWFEEWWLEQVCGHKSSAPEIFKPMARRSWDAATLAAKEKA